MKEEIDEIVEEKSKERMQQGLLQGEKNGENRINQLILKLSELGRENEIVKAAANKEYQEKLLKEFGL